MSDPIDDLLAAPDAPAAPPHAKRWWIKPLKLSLLFSVLALVAWAMVGQWRTLAESKVPIHVRPLPLLGAFAALVAVACVQLISDRYLLAAHATAPPWRAMPTVAWVPPIAKYVPAAAPLAAMAILSRFGVPISAAASVVLTLDALAVGAGCIIGAPLLLWPPIARHVPGGLFIVVPVMVFGALCLTPPLFTRGINFILGFLKKKSLTELPPASAFVIPILCAFAQWVLTGVALMEIVQSVTAEPLSSAIAQLPICISFAALSQTIGYFAFFAPGGLGVREAILLAGLTPLVGPLAAVIVPIRAIAQIIVDVCLAGVGLRCSGSLSRVRTGEL